MANFFAALPIVAALLLFGAGIAKVISPTSAVDGLVAVGLPVQAWMVRLGALCEAMLGAVSLAIGSPVLRMLMVLSYVAFAVYLNVARTSPAVKSCGCFGESGSPPTIRQIVVDLLVALGVGFAMVVNSPTITSLLTTNVAEGVMLSGLCVLSAWLMTFVLDSPIRRLP